MNHDDHQALRHSLTVYLPPGSHIDEDALRAASALLDDASPRMSAFLLHTAEYNVTHDETARTTVNRCIMMSTRFCGKPMNASRLDALDTLLTAIYDQIADAGIRFAPIGPADRPAQLTPTTIKDIEHPGVDVDAWWYETTMPYVLRLADPALVRLLIDKALAWLDNDRGIRAHSYRLCADGTTEGVRLAVLLPCGPEGAGPIGKLAMHRRLRHLDALLVDTGREICERAQTPFAANFDVAVPRPPGDDIADLAIYARVKAALCDWGPTRGLLLQRLLIPPYRQQGPDTIVFDIKFGYLTPEAWALRTDSIPLIADAVSSACSSAE